MGLFDIFRPKRAEGAVTLEELITGNSTMTVKLALQVPAVAWCVNMIASAVAMLPVKLYRKSGDEVEEITNDPRVMILNGDTGDTMNADNMRRRWVYDYLLRGSAFGYIGFKYGVPDKLIYIPENVVSVLKSENDYIRKRFSYMVNGEEILPYRMLKILRNSDGFGKGVGIVEESPLILETMFQLLKFQKNQVLKGGNKRGFLQSKGVVSPETQESIKKNWANIYSDDMNINTVMFLNGEVDFKEMSASSVEMQVNENVKTNDIEIMRLFGTLDGILSKDTVKNAVMPVMDAFEAAFDSDLLLEKEKADHYFAFDTKELTRGDMGERFSAYGMAIDKNIMQIDEVRKAEDLPPLGFNYIKLGLQDVLLNPETGEVYTPNTNATANMNALGKIGGENEDRAKDDYDDYLQDPSTGRMMGRKGHGGSGSFSEKGLDKSEKSVIMESTEKKPITQITDEAIDKVPYVQIEGYTEEQCAEIQKQHKELLAYSRDNNNCNEVAFVLNSSIGNRKEIKGSDDTISFGDELHGKDLVVLHNHPRNSSFSDTDIVFFAENSQVKTFTIVKNNGKVEYITKSDSFNEPNFKLESARLYKKMVKTGSDSEIDKFVKKLLSSTKNGVIWSERKQ